MFYCIIISCFVASEPTLEDREKSVMQSYRLQMSQGVQKKVGFEDIVAINSKRDQALIELLRVAENTSITHDNRDQLVKARCHERLKHHELAFHLSRSVAIVDPSNEEALRVAFVSGSNGLLLEETQELASAMTSRLGNTHKLNNCYYMLAMKYREQNIHDESFVMMRYFLEHSILVVSNRGIEMNDISTTVQKMKNICLKSNSNASAAAVFSRLRSKMNSCRESSFWSQVCQIEFELSLDWAVSGEISASKLHEWITIIDVNGPDQKSKHVAYLRVMRCLGACGPRLSSDKEHLIDHITACLHDINGDLQIRTRVLLEIDRLVKLAGR